jgi:hypothetical protein
MKRRFFTFLALIMVLGCVFSVAEAQKIENVWIDVSDDGGVYRKMDQTAGDERFIPDTLIMGTYGKTKLCIQFEDREDIESEITVELLYSGVAAYLGLPGEVLVDTAQLNLTPAALKERGSWNGSTWYKEIEGLPGGWGFPQSMNGGTVSIAARIKGSGDEYKSGYKPSHKEGGYVLVRPFFSFEPVNGGSGGYYVRCNGLSPILADSSYRQIDEKGWLKEKLSKPLQLAEYQSLTAEDTVSVWIMLDSLPDSENPYGASPINPISSRIHYKIPMSDYLPKEGEEIPGPTVNRHVTVDPLTDASVDIPKSLYVKSTTNLAIKLTPKGDNVNKVPVLKTNRVNGEELDITWTREKNADGSYTITILRIQENFTITGFDFEEDTSSADAIGQGVAVWAANGRVYITSAVAADAKVYSAAGALVKTETVVAGETADVSLPAGIYIVTLGDKSYKVVVR